MPAPWPGTPKLQRAPAPRPEPHLARHRRGWQRWQRSIQTKRNGLQQFSFRRRYPTILDDTVGAGCDDIFFNRCDNPSSSKRHSRLAQPLSPPADEHSQKPGPAPCAILMFVEVHYTRLDRRLQTVATASLTQVSATKPSVLRARQGSPALSVAQRGNRTCRR